MKAGSGLIPMGLSMTRKIDHGHQLSTKDRSLQQGESSSSINSFMGAGKVHLFQIGSPS